MCTMRSVLSSLFLIIYCVCNAEAVMPSIQASLFINGAKTDLQELINDSDRATLKNDVEKLFNVDQFDHLFSKAYDKEALFSMYWKKNQSFWSCIDLNKDGKNELLYQSTAKDDEEIEFVEIYTKQKGEYQLNYKESGHFIAYKIHPNTKEVVLFHHQYPCCTNASHSIYMVRLVKGKIKLRKKYFLARDKEMKGDFFPKHVQFKPNYHFLKKQTIVRWSPEKITKNAWKMFQENKLAKYPKNTPYKILSKKGNWVYIEICGEPKIDKNKPYEYVINSVNFNDVHVFGWIFFNVE